MADQPLCATGPASYISRYESWFVLFRLTWMPKQSNLGPHSNSGFLSSILPPAAGSTDSKTPLLKSCYGQEVPINIRSETSTRSGARLQGLPNDASITGFCVDQKLHHVLALLYIYYASDGIRARWPIVIFVAYVALIGATILFICTADDIAEVMAVRLLTYRETDAAALIVTQKRSPLRLMTGCHYLSQVLQHWTGPNMLHWLECIGNTVDFGH